jgi:hypothetical protein
MTSQEEGGDGRVEIGLIEGALLSICDQIEAVLVERDPELFQHKGALFWKSPNGPVEVDATILRLRAMRVARFWKMTTSRRGFVEVDLPIRYCRALLAKRKWNFPMLDDEPPERGRE